MLNKYFEKIYCISLKRRTDRREKISSHLNSLGIDFEFFDAIDGKEIQNVNPNLNHGEIGCILSHLEIYKKSISDGIGDYLIIEDDCEFHLMLNHLFSEFYKQLPDDWCLVYLGGNHNHSQIQMIDKNIHKLHKTYTTHCYGVRKGFSEFLVNSMDRNIDSLHQADVELSDIQRIKPCYGIIPHLAWQAEGFSDIVGEYRDYNFLKNDGNPR
jgi:hypothetical protein